MATTITISQGGQPGTRNVVVKQDVDAEAEACDPYAMGWDAGADLDEPPPCPFQSGISMRLWRQGFSARVDAYIGEVKSAGGINANIAKKKPR